MASAAPKKTNVARLLDAAGVTYTVRQYDFDPDDLNATHAADAFGLERGRVFKTLVARGDRTGPCVFVVPSDCSLDLKAAAKASGNKSIEMLHVRDLPTLTGYQRGACSPLGMKKHFPTFADASMQLWPSVTVSAGQRGVMVEVNPHDIARVAQMTFAQVAVKE